MMHFFFQERGLSGERGEIHTAEKGVTSGKVGVPTDAMDLSSDKL